MVNEPDLYAVLGVAKSASDDEIRRVYRKLAREHHPDLNPGKPEAEERFKAIAAAYDVLSNKEKRALYDEFGSEGLRGGFDPEQARAYRRWANARESSSAGQGSGLPFEGAPFEFDLDDLLGRTRGRTRAASPFPVAGADVAATVDLDFASALRGIEVELSVPSLVDCSACGGSGARSGTAARPCEGCGGHGRTQAVRGPLRMTVTCPVCGGRGEVHEPCDTCDGKGTLEGVERVRVRIPPGAASGDELRVRGKGGPGLLGGAPGDLIIHTRVKPHPHFERDGLDLRLRLPLTIGEAYSGTSISVPTPSGAVRMKVPPRSQQGAELRLRGKGVARGTDRGDLYVVLDLRMPDRDDEALSALMSQLDAYYTTDLREGVDL